ncbi:MAG: tRNA (adenosine(37)-N6)-dimethylallyltransferase MiaA, partial [Fibrobacteraceae bacterium]|nr:tRNA (adenosine(37)-N6)-dimethylallyltransferase MiaA [Fibrobacteraceae bacterium]
MPILFALVGATGVGKSKLSLDLACRYNAEIIGVDSRQVYRDFCIGTAQPNSKDLSAVKHHLVDFLPPTESYSAGAFCRDVKSILNKKGGKNFILVGGTGLYMQALQLGLPELPDLNTQSDIRKELNNRLQTLGAVNLYEIAKKIDPETTIKIEPNNVQRLMRVIEIFETTGKKLSEIQKKRVGGLGPIKTFWLSRERFELYRRIDFRVDQMMKDGWMDEVQALAKTVPLDAPAWQSLGYRELLHAQTAE